MSNKNLLIIAAICFALGTLTRLMDTVAPNAYALSDKDKAMIGQPSPQFSFRTLDGRLRDLNDYRGKAVIINFWATWCPPCVMEFPAMLRMAAAVEEEAVLIFISSDRELSAIRRFVEKMRQTHERELDLDNVLIAQDQNSAITGKLFGTYNLPETYLLSGDHVVREKIIGARDDWDQPAMIEKIAELAQTRG